MDNEFGKTLWERRINTLKLPLRQFCKKTGYDPAYISRLENGLIKAPRTKKLLNKLFEAYEINEALLDIFLGLARKSRLEY